MVNCHFVLLGVLTFHLWVDTEGNVLEREKLVEGPESRAKGLRKCKIYVQCGLDDPMKPENSEPLIGRNQVVQLSTIYL